MPQLNFPRFVTLFLFLMTVSLWAPTAVGQRRPPVNVGQNPIAIELLVVSTAEETNDKLASRLSGPSDKVAAAVRELETGGKVAVIERIHLTTLENQEASVQVGKQVAVPTGRAVSGRSGAVQYSYERLQVGTMLSAIARVDGKAIVVQIEIESSRLEQPGKKAVEDAVLETPTIVSFSSKVTARIETGQTVLISGMESNSTGKPGQHFILASARLLKTMSPTKPRPKASSTKARVSKSSALKNRPLESSRAAIDASLGEDSGRSAKRLDARTSSVVVDARRKQFEVVDALIELHDGTKPKATSVLSTSLSDTSTAEPMKGVGNLLQAGQWATLVNDNGGYRVRILTVEQKATAEKTIAKYQEKLGEYRSYLNSRRERGRESAAVRPTEMKMPTIPNDLKYRKFYRIVSVADGFVELKSEGVHAVLPMASIRLFSLGATGDVPGQRPTSRSFAPAGR